MATWVRQGTGTAPTATDADLVGEYLLDNATAPVDFDPTAVNSVRCEWTVTGSGFGDDSWNDDSCALITSGGTEISQHPGAGGTGLQNTSVNNDHTDSTGIPTGLSVAEWESARVRGDGTTIPNEWVDWVKSKGPDGSTLAVSALTVTIDYTAGAATQDLTPTLFSVTPSFPTAELIQEQFITAPGAATPLLEDDFSGDLSKWIDISDTNATVTIDSGEALFTTGASSHEARLAADISDLTDVEVLMKWTPGTADGVINVRSDGVYSVGSDVPGNGYMVNVQESGTTNYNLYKIVSGSQSSIGSANRPSNNPTWVRFRVDGDTLQVRQWEDGTTEPGTWDIDVTDSDISGPGQVDLATWNNGTDGTTVRADDVTITDLNAAVGPSISITPSFPTATIEESASTTQDLTPALLSVTPSFPTATVTPGNVNLVPSLLSIVASFGTASIDSAYTVTAPLLSVTPSFPQATVVPGEVTLTPTLLTIPTTFPFASIGQQIQGATLSIEPSFGNAEIKAITILASNLVSLTASFGQAQLNQGISASLHSITASFPTATIGSFAAIQGVLASLAVSFGTATVTSTYDVTPATLDVTLTFPSSQVEGAGTVQDIQPTTLSLSPSFPTAKMGVTLLGSVLTVGPSFGTATIGLTVKPNTLGLLPTFPTGGIDPVYDVAAPSVQLFPTFGTATIVGDQGLTPDTLLIAVVFPSGNLANAGTPLTPIDTEGQGIAQEMCAARGLSSDLDWLGSLNALNGGTDLDKLGVLHALGATPNADLLLSLEQLAFDGQGPGDFNELMRRWAESGNF